MRSPLLRHVSRLLTAADCVSLSPPLNHPKFVHLGSSPSPSMSEDFEHYAKRYFIFEEAEPDVFRTSNLVTFRQGSSKAAYGGLIFAQALAAAENTVDETLKPHAMHSFFILCVDTSVPVQYHVRRVRDGRSFCTRTVEAMQNGKIVFVLQVSFHKLEGDAVVHQDTMPDVPSWRELKSMTDLVPWLMTEITEGRIQVKPVVEKRLKNYDNRASQDRELFEIRPTDAERHLGFGEMNHPTRTFYSWFKSKGSLGDCEKLHRYLVAYTTDATMGGSAYRPHLVNDFSPTMLFSLDHNVWMHKHEMRADQWMLFENTSTVAGRGRAFTTGKLWSEDGILLLSCTQEVVLRGNGQVSRL
nr:Acyl-CoA thioesterase domain containing protein [Haemonchus contortus]